MTGDRTILERFFFEGLCAFRPFKVDLFRLFEAFADTFAAGLFRPLDPFFGAGFLRQLAFAGFLRQFDFAVRFF
jgi:hypothetical protein